MRKILFILVLIFFANCSEHKKKTKNENNTVEIASEETILLLYNKEVGTKTISELKSHLQNAFKDYKIVTKEAKTLPKSLRSAMRPERFRADSILRYLNSNFDGQALKVILITDKGISCTKYSTIDGEKKVKEPKWKYLDWGIFGLGACPGYTCVVSTKFLWARNANQKTFMQRLKNISVHELGHTFGLPHCPIEKCVMNDANETIVTIDKSTGLFCAKCVYNLPL